MAVLVTGIGYIGARLVERLLERGEEVIGLDNFFSTDKKTLLRLARHPRAHFLKGSITNPKAVESAFSLGPHIEVVYHLAAQASGHPEAANSRYTEATNLTGPRLLLDIMRQHGTFNLVFASSLRVYGEDVGRLPAEDSPYGEFADLSHLSKYYTEKLLEMYCCLYGFNAASLRLGVTYGLSPVMKESYRFMTAPNKFCLQAVRGQAVSVYSDKPTYVGFIHVDDAAGALSCLPGNFQGCAAFNGATEITTVHHLAALVAREGERLGLPVFLNGAAADDEYPAKGPLFSPRLAEMGFEPRHCLVDGVREVLGHFLKAKGKMPS